MRHRKTGLKLNRTPSHRNVMFRNMVTSLFKHDRIRTTGAKAKELRRWADHIITLAKRGDLHARRQALAIVREKDVVHKLFETANERFGSVSGGYTRVVKAGFRPGDAAPMAIIELVTPEPKAKKKKAKKKKAASVPTPAAPPAVESTPEETAPAAAASADTADDAADVPEAEAQTAEAEASVEAETASDGSDADAPETDASEAAATEKPDVDAAPAGDGAAYDTDKSEEDAEKK